MMNFADMRPKSFERLMPTVFKALSSEPGGGNPFAQHDIVEMRATEDAADLRPGIYRVRYPDMAYIIRPYQRPDTVRQSQLRRQFEYAELRAFEARIRRIQPQTAWIRVAAFIDRTHPRVPYLHFDLYVYMGEGTYTVEPFEELSDEKAKDTGRRADSRRAGA